LADIVKNGFMSIIKLLMGSKEKKIRNYKKGYGSCWKSLLHFLTFHHNFSIMTKSTRLVNAPSTTGKPSGGGRGNNAPKPAAPEPKPKK
jgi:uncharacterized membrane protein